MRRPRPLPPHAEQELLSLLDQTRSKSDYRRALCLWLRIALGLPAAEIATALNWTTGSVHNLHSLYLRQGLTALSGPGRGGRHRQLLTLEQERTFLAAFSSTAAQGGVAEASAVRAALEQQLGHEVNKSTLYRMLARHGWRKLVPRPYHPETSPAEQEAFKKSFAVWFVAKRHAKRNAVWRCA